MHEINLDDAKIKIDGEWLSTEDLARKIDEKIQAGEMKFSHLAAALEKLNKAIETGKGKPHLNPVKDTMARANNLTTAMVLAPVAGIAAAVGRFVKLAKNSQ